MSSETRLFVGNLPENTNEDLLHAAFSVYGQVTNLDLKSKSLENEQKKFAFVTLSGTHYNIESCIKHFSTEFFNGHQLYVTRARESFLERLQRERQQAQDKETEKNFVTEKLPKEIPVLKLSEKLNPRKRKQDDKYVSKDIYHRTPNSFGNYNNNNAWTDLLSGDGQSKSPMAENDKKKQDSDKKRMDSMKKKRQEFKQKQMIIKTGLVGVDNVKNKKIIFSDDEGTSTNTNSNKVEANKKDILFDNDESDDDVNFEIKKQYEGKMGQKVLDLQSRYKSDKRFIIDERFVEDEDQKSTEEKEEQSIEEQDEEIAVGQTDEKAKQLNILQDVLGVPIKSHNRQPNNMTDNKKRSKLGMLRFDPTQPDHAKFLATVENTQESKSKSKKKKSTEKQIEETKLEIEKQDVAEVKVLKEQFYKISDTLKETIAQPTTFSLRSLFSKNEDEEKELPAQDPTYITLEKQTDKKVRNPLDPGEKNPFMYDSSDSEDDVPPKEINTELPTLNTDIKTVWKENLFFTKLDNRLKDGLEFFSKTPVNEVPKERRELKSLMKKRIYNKDRKNQMFQKKIGGRKKTLKKSYRKKS